MADIEGRKSSDAINVKMSDDEEVASYVPPRYLFFKRFLKFVENKRRLFLFSYIQKVRPAKRMDLTSFVQVLTRGKKHEVDHGLNLVP